MVVPKQRRANAAKDRRQGVSRERVFPQTAMFARSFFGQLIPKLVEVTAELLRGSASGLAVDDDVLGSSDKAAVAAGSG